ncbi:MAG: aldo/keto reductase [Spirochaetales bacterium]|nr:aldo/keto reductase [Spirochaetales bacterium]
MKYRKMGKTGFEVSALGFGIMRMPLKKGAKNDKEIDEELSIRMIRRAVDAGVNYFDTAYVYHSGVSENLLGKALKDGYRQKVKIATKLPLDHVKEPADFDRVLEEQLARLEDEIVDFYLFHGIGAKGWDKIVKLDLIDKAEKFKKAGKIGHIGFSFHDSNEAFHKIIDGYDKWEFCQIQYNYMDTENQAGMEGLRYAASKGLAVIIMEPLLGGRLARPPKDIAAKFNGYPAKRSPADWAFQWIWNQPEVSTVLSGMSALEHVEQNLVSADSSGAGTLSAEDVAFVESLKPEFLKRAVIPCTKCNYCMPCPSGVNIPWNFEMYNEGIMYDDFSAPRFGYKHWFPDKEKADQCTACAVCEEQCPQKITISEWMPRVFEELNKS